MNAVKTNKTSQFFVQKKKTNISDNETKDSYVEPTS